MSHGRSKVDMHREPDRYRPRSLGVSAYGNSPFGIFASPRDPFFEAAQWALHTLVLIRMVVSMHASLRTYKGCNRSQHLQNSVLRFFSRSQSFPDRQLWVHARSGIRSCFSPSRTSRHEARSEKCRWKRWRSDSIEQAQQVSAFASR